MTFRYEIRSSIDDVNADHWDRVSRAGSNPFVERTFVRAVERSMRDPGWYRHAVLYDAESPVAVASFSLYDVDVAMLAPKPVQWFTRTMRKVLRRFLVFRMLLCGLPVSTGSSNLAVVPGTDWERVSTTLARIAEQLARETKSVLISFKEFDPEQTEQLSGLLELGYYRGDSVISWVLEEDCSSYEEYYNSRSKRTRANMRKYYRQVEEAKIDWTTLSGNEGVPEQFTDEVHELYEQVYARAEVQFEHLNAEFFRKLALECPDTSRFTFFSRDGQIVGFCVALVTEQSYDMLYCGLDYSINESSNLYFNLLYRGLEDGYNMGRQKIHIGASADEFKRRMGCRGVLLSVFVKGAGKIAESIVKRIAPMMFPELDRAACRHDKSETAR